MTATGARSPAAASPPPELVARFKAALDRLWPQGGRLGLAVSGGPDSMAMLLLAAAAIPGRFEVATVDHGLRSEAKDECALVERACYERGIACAVLRVEVGEGNLQQRAREARYSALAEWARACGLAAVLTAHHADDQAETLLMRLNRGSGLSGLAGVRPVTNIRNVAVVRPLLGIRRAALAGLVQKAGIGFASDPSNSDEAFDRVRIRKALEEADWLDPLAIAKSAELLADAEHFVTNELGKSFDANVMPSADESRYFPGTSQFENVEIAVSIFREMGVFVRRSEVARMVERLWAGENASLGGILASSERSPDGMGADGRVWTFRREPPRRTG